MKTGRWLVGVAFLSLMLMVGCECGKKTCPPVSKSKRNVCPTTKSMGKDTGTQQYGDIIETASQRKMFSTFINAVQSADLTEQLKSTGPFTVFAPTDGAFEKLPAGMLDDLLKPENKAQLQELLRYHIVAGKLMSGQLAKRERLSTQAGKLLNVALKENRITLDDRSQVVVANLRASNGVIHGIDEVLIPPGFSGKWGKPSEKTGMDQGTPSKSEETGRDEATGSTVRKAKPLPDLK